MVNCTICIQKAVCSLYMNRLCVRSLWLRQHCQPYVTIYCKICNMCAKVSLAIRILINYVFNGSGSDSIASQNWRWCMATSTTHHYEDNGVRSKMSWLAWVQVTCEVTSEIGDRNHRRNKRQETSQATWFGRRSQVTCQVPRFKIRERKLVQVTILHMPRWFVLPEYVQNSDRTGSLCSKQDPTESLQELNYEFLNDLWNNSDTVIL